jgi:hypothetical protein
VLANRELFKCGANGNHIVAALEFGQGKGIVSGLAQRIQFGAPRTNEFGLGGAGIAA